MTATTSTTEPTTESPADERFVEHPLAPGRIAIHDPATQFPALQASAATRGLIRALADQARATMLAGAPLVHRLSGRTGWELRAVVQGGLRVLDHIAALNDDTLSHRPTLRRRDGWMIAARALAM